MWCANNLYKQLGQNKYGKFKTDYSFYPYPTYSVDLENRLYFLPPPPPLFSHVRKQTLLFTPNPHYSVINLIYPRFSKQYVLS